MSFSFSLFLCPPPSLFCEFGLPFHILRFSGVVLCPFFSSSSFLGFCGFFVPSSRMCCDWGCGFSWGEHHGALSSCLESILPVCLSCFCPLYMLSSFSGFGGRLSLVFLVVSLVVFPFHIFSFSEFSYIGLLLVCLVPFSFSKGVGDFGEGGGVTHLLPLVFVVHHRCRAYKAFRHGALLLRLPPL